MLYTIKQVSEILKIPATKLRYYAKFGLYPTISRDQNNQRCFNEWDLNWVYLVDILSKTGMPLKAVRHYVEIAREGDTSVPERYQMLLDVKKSLDRQQHNLEEQQQVIDQKIGWYRKVLNGQTVDKWNPQTIKEKYRDRFPDNSLIGNKK
ncbi:MerR family transcriptional regulator [Oenococcus sp. UCMA 17063]|nr:MerR family transcriptional regulator [Oenococcus sp. UCMA 17063]